MLHLICVKFSKEEFSRTPEQPPVNCDQHCWNNTRVIGFSGNKNRWLEFLKKRHVSDQTKRNTIIWKIFNYFLLLIFPTRNKRCVFQRSACWRLLPNEEIQMHYWTWRSFFSQSTFSVFFNSGPRFWWVFFFFVFLFQFELPVTQRFNPNLKKK